MRVLLVLVLLSLCPAAHAAYTPPGQAGGMSVTATGSATARTLADRAADTVQAADFGAKGDAQQPQGYVSLPAGSNALIANAAAFTAADVGKYIEIPGAGATTVKGVSTIPMQESGNHYTAVPSCAVTGDGSGATCAVSAMNLQSVTLTSNGTGCTDGWSAFSIAPTAGGRAAQFYATVSGGTITGTPQVTDAGSFPTMPGSLSGVTATGPGCSAQPVVTLTMAVSAIAVTAAGSGYTYGAATLTGGSPWTAASAGYAMVQPAVAPMASRIVAVTGAHTVTLADSAATAVSSNATITYGTDDTVALQAALATNKFVELAPSRIYLARNLTLGSAPPSGTTPQAGIITRSGNATIRAIVGGDAGYLIATPAWLNGGAYGDTGVLCRGVVFDGGGIAQDVVATRNWASTWNGCIAQNGRRYGFWLAGQARDGTLAAAGASNVVFRDAGAMFNGGDGLRIDHNGPTDTQIAGGYWHDNAGWQLYLGRMAGALINQIHTYSISNLGMFVDGYGWGSSVMNSIFEDQVNINSMATSGSGVFGPGNTLEQRLTVGFKDGGDYKSFRSLGNVYLGSGQLYNAYNWTDHVVYSDHDQFQSWVPFGWGGTLAIIIANGSQGSGAAFGNTGAATYDGLQFAYNSNMAANKVDTVKFLSNTGTTTTFSIIVSVHNGFPMAGFSMRGRVNAWSLSGAGANDTYTADFRAEYMRQAAGTGAAKRAVLLNPGSANGTVSATIAVADVPNATADNQVTITITLTHPQAPDQYSSSASLHLESENRGVTALTAN